MHGPSFFFRNQEHNDKVVGVSKGGTNQKSEQVRRRG